MSAVAGSASAASALVRSSSARSRGDDVPTLDQLRPGGRGRVLSLQGDPALVQRLLDMGLLEGEEVEVVGFAPLGDPLEVRLGAARLTLRRRDAAGIEVHEL
jgi:ferrous iron transport protein A